jgi:hypothetical protein
VHFSSPQTQRAKLGAKTEGHDRRPETTAHLDPNGEEGAHIPRDEGPARRGRTGRFCRKEKKGSLRPELLQSCIGGWDQKSDVEKAVKGAKEKHLKWCVDESLPQKTIEPCLYNDTQTRKYLPKHGTKGGGGGPDSSTLLILLKLAGLP